MKIQFILSNNIFFKLKIKIYENLNLVWIWHSFTHVQHNMWVVKNIKIYVNDDYDIKKSIIWDYTFNVRIEFFYMQKS